MISTGDLAGWQRLVPLNFRRIWINKNPIQRLHSLTWLQFFCASLNFLGSSLRRCTKNNPVIKFYHLLKVKLRHIHKQSGCHAWFVTHWGQRENTGASTHQGNVARLHYSGSMICKINTCHFPKRLLDFFISIFYSDKRFMKKLSTAHVDLKAQPSAWIFMVISADQKGLISRCWPSRLLLPPQ